MRFGSYESYSAIEIMEFYFFYIINWTKRKSMFKCSHFHLNFICSKARMCYLRKYLRNLYKLASTFIMENLCKINHKLHIRINV